MDEQSNRRKNRAIPSLDKCYRSSRAFVLSKLSCSLVDKIRNRPYLTPNFDNLTSPFPQIDCRSSRIDDTVASDSAQLCISPNAHTMLAFPIVRQIFGAHRTAFSQGRSSISDPIRPRHLVELTDELGRSRFTQHAQCCMEASTDHHRSTR
jgi:hypothetical protein